MTHVFEAALPSVGSIISKTKSIEKKIPVQIQFDLGPPFPAVNLDDAPFETEHRTFLHHNF
jgi:hypothetical protein